MLGEKGKGIKQKTKQNKTLTDTDNSMLITRRKGGWREVEEGKGGIDGDRMGLNFGW